MVDGAWEMLLEQATLLAVNKPGNLPSHPGGRYLRHTLWWLLRAHLGHDPHLLNRLDRETSGIVLVARDGATAGRLQALWTSGQVQKDYLAVVQGFFPESVQAEGYLSAEPQSPVRKQRRFTTHDPGDSESASTHFRCLARGTSASLVLCQPVTVRLHQLRATLLGLGYPILGDKLYGGDPTQFLKFVEGTLSQAELTASGIARQALHAWRLTLPDLSTPGEQLAIIAPPPTDLTMLMAHHGLTMPVA